MTSTDTTEPRSGTADSARADNALADGAWADSAWADRAWADRASRRRARLATGLGTGVAAVFFFLVLLDFATDLQRQATGVGFASQFFDLQANAIRHGHLWVTQDALGIEGFEVGGKSYLYFGIFPALLRLPLQLVTDDYVGKLSLISMGIAWVIFAVMGTRLFWLIRDSLGRPRHLGRTEALLSGLFLVSVLGGSVVTFDASLPWVYHEVYLWSMASVVGSLYWLLRVIREPAPGTIAWLFTFVLIACLTRTTGGWAVCLATLAVGVWLASGRLHPGRRRMAIAVVGAALVPWMAAIVVNYLKFKHPFLFPLQDQVWTQLNEHRRDALAANGGTLVGPQFLPTSLVNYLRPDGIRFVDYFPWVTFPATPARGYGAVLDQSYRTGSITSFMPLLVLLTLISIPVLFRRLPTAAYRGVRLIWIGALLVTGGVMAYGYVAFRYTSEFIPVLLVGGAVATSVIGGWLSGRRRLLGRLVVGAFVLLAGFGLLANTAAGFYTAATNYRGAPLERYLGIQTALSGSTSSFAGLVHTSSNAPSGGSADDLWIRGDCDALYLNTGEAAEPWVLVQERDTAMRIRTNAEPYPGTYELMHSTSPQPRTVWLEIMENRQARINLRNEGGEYRGTPFDLPPNADIRVGARNLTELGHAEISAMPGGFVGYLATSDWSTSWLARPSHLTTARATDPELFRTHGISITPAPTLPLPLCRRIAKAADVQTSAAD